MRCDSMRRVSADAFRKQQTDNQSDKREQNKEPKNRSQKKEKVAKSREREGQEDRQSADMLCVCESRCRQGTSGDI